MDRIQSPYARVICGEMSPKGDYSHAWYPPLKLARAWNRRGTYGIGLGPTTWKSLNSSYLLGAQEHQRGDSHILNELLKQPKFMKAHNLIADGAWAE